jgi:carboxymethylenebutenolidase
MDVHTEEIHFAGHGEDELRAVLHRPETASDPLPGIVLVHEVFGADAFMLSVGERLAQAGFVTILPDLYSREGLPGPAATADEPAPEWTADQIRAAVASLPDRRVLQDLDAAARRLAGEPAVDSDRIATLGFCMGGCYAFLLGCHSRRIAAVVDFYGRIVYPDLDQNKPVQPLEMALNLSAPLLAVFGEDDSSIPAEHVEALRDALTRFARSFELKTIPGARHGFVNHLRNNYSQPDAEAVWEETLSFLGEALELDD